MLRLFTILLLSFLSIKLGAQEHGKATVSGSYRLFDIKDGLPQMQITALSKDAHGMVWVSTKGGLARWDGKQFFVYNNRTPHFGYGESRKVLMPGEGSYLLQQSRSLRLIRGNQVRRFRQAAFLDSLFVDDIFYTGNAILAQCSYKDQRYMGQNRILSRLQRPDYSSFTSTIIKGDIMAVFTDSSFISSTYTGHLRSRNYYYHINDKAVDSAVNMPYTHYHYNNTGVVYYNPDEISRDKKIPCKRLVQLSVKNNRFVKKEYPLLHPVVFNQFETNCFIPINDSIYYYVDAANKVHLADGKNETDFCKVPVISASLLDEDNNLWLGTEQGLYLFYRNGFMKYHFGFSGTEMDNTWSLAGNKEGKYYVAEYNKGIYELNAKTQEWQRIHFSINDPTQRIYFFETMRTGTFAAAQLWNGDVLLPLGQGFAVKSRNKPPKLFLLPGTAETYGTGVDSLHRCVYIAQYTKAFRLNADYSLDTLPPPEEAGFLFFKDFEVDKKGRVIAGGNRKTHSVALYRNGHFDPLPVNISGVWSLSSDYKSNLWIASEDSLFFYDYDSLQRFSVPVHVYALSVKAYNDKWLIIGGGQEIVLMDLQAFYQEHRTVFYRYDFTNGYNGMETSQNSIYLDNDGSVWVPAARYTWRFFPDKLQKSNSIYTPVIDGILFSGKDFQWQQDTCFFQKNISLSPAHRNLQFLFAAATGNGNELVFRYRLKGYDDNWSSPTTTPIAIFSNLPPGCYTFEVQCSADAKQWSKAAVSKPIELIPYYYETSWFLVSVNLLGLMVISLTAYLVLRIRYRQKQKRQEQISQSLLLRLQAVRSQTIPHFSNNAYQAIDSLIEQGRKQDASEYLAIISRLHNKILLDSARASRSIQEELEFVNHYLELEKLRFGEKLHYKIEISPGTDTHVQIPVMAVHTYVENAIKHGLMNKKGQGAVQITVRENEEGTILTVTDDGIGRDAAKHSNQFSTKKGLSILTQQIEIYNMDNQKKIIQEITDLKDEAGNAAGTECKLFIPRGYKFRDDEP